MAPPALSASNHELQRIVEVSLVLNSTLELNRLLRYIMDAASDLVGSESASILLVDHNTQELIFTASSSDDGTSTRLLGQPVPIEGSIAGSILKENRPFVLNDVSNDPRHYREMDNISDFVTRSILGVPMTIKDEVVGVLEAVNKIEGQWTKENRNALMVLASQAAVAIHNAQLVDALRHAYDELDKLDKLKHDFISIASHELRTPLSVILGYASFLQESQDAETKSFADVVTNSALKLRELIEQMTNLTYLKQGDVELGVNRVPVHALVKGARDDIASLVAAKAHRFQCDIDNEEYWVLADQLKVETALGNLLNNAVKFTPPGGQITVRTTNKPNEVWIAVEDSGVGIPPEQLDKIFDEFFQVEDHLTRRHGGMGLGLSIARALIEAQDGRIWAESAGPDQGSTFFISLPKAS